MNTKETKTLKNPTMVTIYVPLEVAKIKCQHCGIEYAILALLEDGNWMLQGNEQSKLYCPYCGKIAY